MPRWCSTVMRPWPGNGTRSLFERAGFSYVRHKGKNHCVMRKTIA